MSLRVWLPLNGSLENKGLSDINLTGSPIYATGGKIGNQCLASQLGWFEIPDMAGKKQMSFAYWVKINTATSTDWLDTFSWYSTDGSTNYRSRQEFYTNSTQTGVWFQGGSIGTVFKNTVGDWNHYVFTIDYDKGEAKFYINGEELTNPILTVDTTHYIKGIGSAFLLRESALDSHINDFRLYDHILSPFEVKQISQGLVLHYPLNHGGLGQENLLRHQIKDSQWTNWSNATTTREKIVINGKTWAHLIQTSSSGYGGYTISPSDNEIIIDNTKKYTWSCTAMAGTNTNAEIILWLHWRSTEGGSNIAQSSKKFLLTTNPQRISYTIDPSIVNTSYTINRINLMMGTFGTANNEVYFTDIKFEQGSIATSWCPNEADELATALGMNENIEYDCSGYGNNGQYYKYDSTGDYFFVSDTPKYSTSLHIASANPTVNAALGTVYLYGHCGLTTPEQLTIAFWCKPIEGYTESTGHGQFCTTNYEYGNAAVGSDYQDSAMNHRDSWINMNGSESDSQISPSVTFDKNEWHHYVATYDGKTGVVYKDAQVISTKAFSKSQTLESFIGVVIGFSKAGGVWRRNDSYYSDFRVYCTALSPEDVLNLYNLSAAIDTNNNLYGVMLEEG